jgi:hypothetical protein
MRKLRLLIPIAAYDAKTAIGHVLTRMWPRAGE